MKLILVLDSSVEVSKGEQFNMGGSLFLQLTNYVQTQALKIISILLPAPDYEKFCVLEWFTLPGTVGKFSKEDTYTTLEIF